MIRPAGLALALALLAPAASPAQTAPTDAPRTTTRVPVLLLAETTPLKVVLVAGVHQRHVYHSSRSALFDGLYADAGVDALISPSSVGGRVQLEWLPLAVLQLKLAHSVLWYTGVPRGVGHGLTFETRDTPFGSAASSARAGTEENLTVQRSVATATLRGRFWRFSGMSETEVALWYVPSGRPGYWYESVYDLLVARGRPDLTVMNRTLLLFEAMRTGGGLTLSAGPVNEYVRAVDARLERDRLGVALVFTPSSDLWGARAPTAVVMAGGTLTHPSRSGEIYFQLALSGAWEL